MVPGLIYENTILGMDSRVQDGLEIKQPAVGRLAVEVHGKIPNEGVQRDMRWTSFEGREGI